MWRARVKERLHSPRELLGRAPGMDLLYVLVMFIRCHSILPRGWPRMAARTKDSWDF